MSRFTACVLILACGLSLAAAGNVEPKFEPRSNKKFFGKDLPHDKSPVADKHYHFDHPYPAVQDNSDFNSDYTQDQNGDGGKWQAQMEYDILRQKVRQAEKELKVLKRKLEKEAGEMEAAKVEWQAAVSKVEAAKAATDAAQKAEVASNKDVKTLEGEVKGAKNKAEDEMSDLEKCKKALADAKQNLKDLLVKQAAAAEKAAAEKAAAEAAAAKKKAEEEERKKSEEQKALEQKAAYEKKVAEEKAAEEKRLAEEKAAAEKKLAEEKAAAEKKIADQKQKLADALKKHDATAKAHADDFHKDNKVRVVEHQSDSVKRQAEINKLKQAVAADNADLAKDEATWQKKLAEEQTEYAAAANDYNAKVKAMHETEAKLEKARKGLKTFRRAPHVDDNGGVYNVPKSSADGWHLSVAVIASLVAAAVCA